MHNDDFYRYVRGNDCKTAFFPSANLEYSSYLLSMLRDLKKNMKTKKNMVCARARPPRPVGNANQSFRSLRPKSSWRFKLQKNESEWSLSRLRRQGVKGVILLAAEL